ncbi:ATP-binding protein (plasmid) [Azospirillum brasilense]|uniref:ATP-binding protein n=1 Tax=Azospirillum brasilense TaxID=192 RepID=A0A4D8R613_AZOBR|nr:ATP-binding protein [Azospirillum brasilense]QCO16900.1 ATP-binding protein [Azospirillum brasilense]
MAPLRSVAQDNPGAPPDGAAFRRALADIADALHRAEEGIGSILSLTAADGDASRLIETLVHSPVAAGFGILRWPQSLLPPLGGPDDLEAVAVSLPILAGGSRDEARREIALAAERGGGELAGEAVRGLLGLPSLQPLWLGLDDRQRAEFQVEGLATAILDLCYARPVLIVVENLQWARGLTVPLLDALGNAVEDARLCLLTIRSATPCARPGGWTPPGTARRIVLPEPDGGSADSIGAEGDDPAAYAQPLDALRRDRRPERIEWMAHHAPLAGEWALACACARHAGQRAEAGCRLADAARHYRNALAALDRLPVTRRHAQRRIDLWTALARTQSPQDGGAMKAAEKALALADDLGDQQRAARALSLLATLHWAGGNLAAARRVGMMARRIWLRTESSGQQVQTLIKLGCGLTEEGRFRHADTVLRAAAELAPRWDTRHLHGPTALAPVCIAAHRARCRAELGDPEEALRLARAALALAEDSGHAASHALACLHLGWVALTAQRYAVAVEPLKRAVAITETIRLHACQPLVLGALGYALVRTGALNDGASLLLGSREHARMLGIRRHEPQILIWIAEAALLSGQPEDTVRNARDAAGKAAAAGQSGDEAWARLALARGLVAQADGDAARHLEAAARIAGQRSMTPLLAQCADLRKTITAA